MAYRVFFCAVPENRHLSTTWARTTGFFRGLSERRRAAGGAGRRRRLARNAVASPTSGAGGRQVMRLVGSDLACFRGGRQVFAALSFTRWRRRGAAGDRPQWGRQILAAAAWSRAWCGRSGDDSTSKAAIWSSPSASRPTISATRTPSSRRSRCGRTSPSGHAFSAAAQGKRDGRPRRRRPRRARPAAGGLSLGRATAPPLACAADRDQAADLAARRTDLRARHRGAGDAGRSHARASGRRRADRGGRPWTDRARRGEGTRPWGGRLSGCRDERPFRAPRPRHAARRARRRRRLDRRAVLSDRGHAGAVRDRPRPRAAGAHRPGDPLARRAAGEPARARPPAVRWITRTARST